MVNGINGCGKKGCWLQLIFLLNSTQRHSCGSMVTTSAWISERFGIRWLKAWSMRGVLHLYCHRLPLVGIVCMCVLENVAASTAAWEQNKPRLTLQKGFLSLGLERKLPSARGWWAICFFWGSRCARNCCASTGEAWLHRWSAGHLWSASQRRQGCLQGKAPAWGPGSGPASPAWDLALVRCRR